MTHIVAIAGSSREGSYNQALIRASAELAPSNVEIESASIAQFPLYNGDLEASRGVPNAVQDLKERVAAAHGLLLVTPEYNNSIPGVFKNAIDWMSRPPQDIVRVFGDKPVGLIGASPGRGGTRMAQAAWLPVLRALGTRPWFGGQLYVAGASQAFDEHGSLTDERVRELLSTYMQGFAEFVRSAQST